MSCCGCSKLEDGKEIVDHVTRKGKENMRVKVAHEITCQCGEVFVMETLVTNCPKCQMTFGVTHCGSSDINKIKPAGINYAS
ncbi:hypothetical protein DS745_22315 [Anaerobacillus alkaliphilus]|uniref:Uncharacterized protein n=1 Tax=Anaerobacillus alkaliphilus TaxID=1548597 RepID=A0A4Q0VM83_9BACI|nr:hypothetical protein [Anaerobacillus alkaliphilus]RXI96448.1 hypothetical protein DS745_22315 [Anaerobacillus alkaliphilus]